MKLLDFVGLYGTVLAPIGAIIIVDHFFADSLGIARDPAARSGSAFNPVVLIAWLLPVAVAMYGYWQYNLFASYLPLPCAIACGLLHAPRVIYFDEPLTGLDPMGIRRMKDSILKRARDGAVIIISSHLLHLVEEICSRILILKNGRKVIDGTIAEIAQKYSREPGDANLEEVFFRATDEPPRLP